MAKNEEQRGVRITDQFRDRDTMMYDLKCDQVRITISVVAEAKPSEDWNVGALVKGQAPVTLNMVRPSRGEAFDALGLAWTDRVATVGFPSLDWKAIREALVSVRAI